MKKQFILLAVAGLVLTSCGIYTKYQRPEDITTDGLYGHDLDGQSLDSLSLFAASDTASIASLSWRELFTDPQLQSLIEQALQGNTDLLSARPFPGASFLRTRNYSRSSNKPCKATLTCFPPNNVSRRQKPR